MKTNTLPVRKKNESTCDKAKVCNSNCMNIKNEYTQFRENRQNDRSGKYQQIAAATASDTMNTILVVIIVFSQNA